MTSLLKTSFRTLQRRARSERAKIFRDYLHPTAQDRILDLGGGDGHHFASIVPYRANVWVADVRPEPLIKAREQFGFKTVLADHSGRVDFADGYFDIVFCSSVIEHVTGRKDDVRDFRTNRAFFRVAFEKQQAFATEIGRLGKRYFVQTLYKYFPIESHTWLPFFVVLMPRSWQIATIDFFNRWWPKSTSPDWNLLTTRHMRALFPEAEIVAERVLGFTKSLMAIKR